MATDDSLKIKCGTHGPRVASVVCGHILLATERVVGFVENNTDPADLQAWCAECEQMFVRERSMTEAFIKFNDMKVVCDFCYAIFKVRHSTPNDTP